MSLTNFQKNWITVGVLFTVILIAIKFALPSIFNISSLKNQISNLGQALTVAEKVNATLRVQIDSVTSVSTTDKKLLEAQLKEMYKNNDSLKTRVSQLEGELSGVHTGTGNITIGDTLHVEENDSLAYASDNFISLKYNKKSKDIIWNFEASILLEGVEFTDKFGNRQNVENVWLLSKDGLVKKPVPWVSTFISYKPKMKLWHYQPMLHAQSLFGLDGVSFGASFNLFTMGYDKYPATTYFYFLNFGVASDFKDDIYLTAAPVAYNLGGPIPLITNFNVSPTLTLGKKGIGLQIGVSLVL